MRRTSVGLAPLLLVPALAVLAGCATSSPGGTSGTPDGTGLDPDARYTAHATILQPSETAEPGACLGGVAESYPPQCSGPVVVGLDWADVPDAETASGVTWGMGWVVGTYDGETFTLTEPVRQDPPDGVESPGPWTGASYQPLCEDPWRGGDENALVYEEIPEDWPEREFTDTMLSPESMELVGALQERAATLPGYVEMYVSNGLDEFNVLLTSGSDVEAAHASLREVWPGWLCVDTVGEGAPSNADAVAASEALSAAVPDPAQVGLLGWGPDTIAGTFAVTVIIETPALRAQIEEALAPWYSPDQISIQSVLIPVP